MSTAAVDVLRSVEQLDAIGDEWDALAAPSATPLLEHAWVLACARAFHAPDALRIVTVRRQGRLIAAAPLATAPRSGIDRLELIGMARLHEPGGVLYADADALEDLLRAVTALGVPVTLERLEAASAVGKGLPAHLPRPGVLVVRPTASTLVVPIRGEWRAYEKTLSSRITGNLPRLRKRAAKLGEVRVEILRPTPDETPALLDTVMAVEATGWKGRRGSSLLAQADLRAFFTTYALAAARAGRLRIARLWFGSRLAAAELAVVAHRRWWQLKIGYDDALGELYPGLQLTHETVKGAFDDQLEAYEFLGSAASWERRWNPEERRHELVMFYPRSVSALGGLAIDAVGVAARCAADKAGWGKKEPAAAVAEAAGAGDS
jgi:CelD/BcsL family acetyltransferase involved in cellulose biosynthesis